jgi:hypothetical protein
MQLYTVRMNRQQTVTIYSGKTSTTETRVIEQVYHDLPMKTAQAYKTKFPDAEVVILSQGEIVGDKRKTRVVVAGESTAAPRREVARTKKTDKPAPVETGIEASDYAKVVNKMMEAR